MSVPFVLYEALLWEPPQGYFLLENHLDRLQRSAEHFQFSMERSVVRRKLDEFTRELPDRPRKVRLELDRLGAITLEHLDVKPGGTVLAALAREPVRSDDEFLRHKTSRRDVFGRALAAHPEAQDVILWNERRELTETCHANLVLEIEGRKLTPPAASGLLPGVFRGYLLERGEILEQTLTLESLWLASAIFLINSVRRWCPIRLVQTEDQPGTNPITGRTIP